MTIETFFAMMKRDHVIWLINKNGKEFEKKTLNQWKPWYPQLLNQNIKENFLPWICCFCEKDSIYSEKLSNLIFYMLEVTKMSINTNDLGDLKKCQLGNHNYMIVIIRILIEKRQSQFINHNDCKNYFYCYCRIYSITKLRTWFFNRYKISKVKKRKKT